MNEGKRAEREGEREEEKKILQRLTRTVLVKRLRTHAISVSKSAFCQKNKKTLIPRNVPVCWLLEIRKRYFTV